MMLLLMLALPVALFAAVSGDDSVATVRISQKEIEWLPHVPCDQLVLTVSGPGDAYFSETFPAGTNPVFSLFDNDGTLFPDGSCSYELRVISSSAPVVGSRPAGREALEGALIEGGEETPEPQQEALVQSGYFTIRKGYFVVDDFAETDETEPVPGLPEGPPTLSRDVCYSDDLVVDGSLSVGFDSTCNYSFGFDTIVLRENNLRIFFDDTSNSASFPNNDWRITANDSANGGANRFSIEDATHSRVPFTIEANAPSHSLYVDDGGRVGFRTNTPVVDLHTKSGNTPTLRLEQDGSSGFSPQTWDVAGNETNFFIRDATNGSKLPFRIRPGAQSNSIDIEADNDIKFVNGKIYFKSDGKVGIGTDSPSAEFDLVTDGADAQLIVQRNGGARCGIRARTNQLFLGTSNDNPVVVATNSSEVMRLNTTNAPWLQMVGGGTYNGNWNDASSREYKENIQSLTIADAMKAIEELNPVRYNYKGAEEEEHVGFIAEDVPDLVATNGKKTLSTMDIVAVLTRVVQEQQKTINELQGKIAEIEKK